MRIDPDIGGLRRILAGRPLLLTRRQAAGPGAELRAARAGAGLTQRQLSGLMGVSQASISAWERGVTGIPAARAAQWREVCRR